MKHEGPRTMEEARARRDRSSLYLESTLDEQLGLLPGEARKVKSAMSFAVTVASPKTSLKEAMSMMTSLNVPVVVVYDGRRLVGMLTGILLQTDTASAGGVTTSDQGVVHEGDCGHDAGVDQGGGIPQRQYHEAPGHPHHRGIDEIRPVTGPHQAGRPTSLNAQT